MRKQWKLAMMASIACVLPTLSAYAGSNMLLISEGDQNLLNWVAQQWGTGRVVWTGQAGASNQELIPVGGLIPQGYWYEGGGTIVLGNNTSKDLSVLVGNQNHSTGGPVDALPQDKELLKRTGVRNVAMGFYNNQNSYYNTALGQSNTQTGAYNIGVGYNNYTGWTHATALGINNIVIASHTLGVGTANNVTAPYAVAVGNQNTPNNVTFTGVNKAETGIRSITVGSQNGNTGLDAIVVGNRESAVAPQSVSLGTLSVNAGLSSVAIGTGVTVAPTSPVTVGASGAVADTGGIDRAVAIGSWSGATTSDSVALGSYSSGATPSHTWGYSPLTGANLTDVESGLRLMNQLTGETPPPPYTVQQLDNARQAAAQAGSLLAQAQSALRQAVETAHQNNLSPAAQQEADAAVVTAKQRVETLQHEWQQAQTQIAPLSAWYSSLGAVAVGDAAHGVTRQITGVAAGTENTDAVNVAQLKALAFRMKPVNYLNANNTYQRTDVEAALLNAMKMASNTQTESGALAEGAIALGAYANVTGNNGIALGRYATVTGANDVAIGYGAANGPEVWTSGAPKEAFTGIAWNPAQGTVSFGNSAQTLTLDDGSTVDIPAQTRRLRYVAGGIQPTDAVNISQLTALAKMVGVTPADVEKYINTPGAQSIYDQVKANSAAIGANATAIKKLQEHPVTQPAPPAPQPVPQPVDTGWTISAATTGADTSSVVHAGDTVRWQGDQNVTVTLTPDTASHRDAMAVTMSDKPTFNTVTVQGNAGTIVIDGNTGINAGGLKIQNVAAGEIKEGSKDAVNGSQIAKINADNDVKFKKAEAGIQENATQIGKNKTDIEANKAAIGANKKNLDTLSTTVTNQGDTIAKQGISIQALDNGVQGPVVYTDDSGKRLVRTKGGDFYYPEDVDAAGNAVAGKTAVANDKVKLSLVSPEVPPVAVRLGNVAEAVAGTDAVPLDQLKTMLKDHGADPTQAPLVHYDSDKKENITLGGVTTAGHPNVTTGVTIHNLAPGKELRDAVNVGQLKETTQQMHQRIENVAREMDQHISDAGSMAAAMAAMAPLPYRPGDKGQMMAGVGHYGTSTAVALGYAQYANPDVLWRGGMSYANSKHLMWNAGITWRVGLSQQTEAKRRDVEAKTDWKAAYEALAADYGKLAQENQKQKEEIAYIMGILQRHHLT